MPRNLNYKPSILKIVIIKINLFLGYTIYQGLDIYKLDIKNS